MQKRYKADLALGLSAAGFLGTLGVSGTGFWPGLLHHGFLAATIGGLADWFAVTAIFHKPLGISYRTDILRRNRKRIMDAIVQFASDDLLSVDHIMHVVRGQDTGSLMADYLAHRGGRERILQTIDEVLLQTVNGMDSERIARELAPSVREGLKAFPLERILAGLLEILSEDPHARHILHILLTIGRQVLYAPVMQQVLLDNIEVLRKDYEKNSLTRGLVLGALNLDDAHILALFNERMEHWFGQMLRGESDDYAAVKAGLEMLLRQLGKDASLQEVLKGWKEQYLDRADIEALLSSWLDANVKGENPFWIPHLHAFLNRQIDHFLTSHAMQRRFDAFLKDFLESELRKHHVLIPGLIRERLNEFSDDQLVAFVESKVQDDLQMIRINGSLVGSLVGMGLFLLVSVVERMWG